MELKEPYAVYIATTNLEAQVIVEMLIANGVEAFAVEDHSPAGLWMFGTISQIHKPQVFVEKSTAESAARLIMQYEDEKHDRETVNDDTAIITVTCEECGKTTNFPASLDNTVQECAHCHAYVDVGELDWDEDFDDLEKS